jgi:small subunit ribosomal protein S6
VTDYEILLIIDPDATEERSDEILTRARELVEQSGGTFEAQETWGRRRLAYEIDHKAEGVYHLLTFSCESATLEEISRVLRISDGVMRHMATRRVAAQATPVPAEDTAGVEEYAASEAETEVEAEA